MVIFMLCVFDHTRAGSHMWFLFFFFLKLEVKSQIGICKCWLASQELEACEGTQFPKRGKGVNGVVHWSPGQLLCAQLSIREGVLEEAFLDCLTEGGHLLCSWWRFLG